MEDETYDAYLCCSDRDEDWANGVAGQLEAPPYNLRVLLGSRDFVPGVAVVDNMCVAVRRSRVTMLVLSTAFLDSGWCDLDSILAVSASAEAEQVQERNRRVVPVILEACDVPERLRFLASLDARKPYFVARLATLVQGRAIGRLNLQATRNPVPETTDLKYFDVEKRPGDATAEELEPSSCQDCKEWQLKCDALEKEVAELCALNRRLITERLQPSPASGEQPLPLMSFNQVSIKSFTLTAVMGMVASAVSVHRFASPTRMRTTESLCATSEGILLGTRLLRAAYKLRPGLHFE